MARVDQNHGFHQKMAELQEKLKKSEEERLKLEEKFVLMMKTCREEEEERLRVLRMRYEQFLEEDKRRRDRNERILQTLDRIENRASALSAKSERLKILRRHYEAYLMRMYPHWKKKPGSFIETTTPYYLPLPVDTDRVTPLLNTPTSLYSSTLYSAAARGSLSPASPILPAYQNRSQFASESTNEVLLNQPLERRDGLLYRPSQAVEKAMNGYLQKTADILKVPVSELEGDREKCDEEKSVLTELNTSRDLLNVSFSEEGVLEDTEEKVGMRKCEVDVGKVEERVTADILLSAGGTGEQNSNDSGIVQTSVLLGPGGHTRTTERGPGGDTDATERKTAANVESVSVDSSDVKEKINDLVQNSSDIPPKTVKIVSERLDLETNENSVPSRVAFIHEGKGQEKENNIEDNVGKYPEEEIYVSQQINNEEEQFIPGNEERVEQFSADFDPVHQQATEGNPSMYEQVSGEIQQHLDQEYSVNPNEQHVGSVQQIEGICREDDPEGIIAREELRPGGVEELQALVSEQNVEQYEQQYNEENEQQFAQENSDQYEQQYSEENREQYEQQYSVQDSEQEQQYTEQNQYQQQDSEQYSEQNEQQYTEQNQYQQQDSEQYSEQNEQQYAEENRYQQQDSEQYSEQNEQQYSEKNRGLHEEQYFEQNREQYESQQFGKDNPEQFEQQYPNEYPEQNEQQYTEQIPDQYNPEFSEQNSDDHEQYQQEEYKENLEERYAVEGVENTPQYAVEQYTEETEQNFGENQLENLPAEYAENEGGQAIENCDNEQVADVRGSDEIQVEGSEVMRSAEQEGLQLQAQVREEPQGDQEVEQLYPEAGEESEESSSVGLWNRKGQPSGIPSVDELDLKGPLMMDETSESSADTRPMPAVQKVTSALGLPPDPCGDVSEQSELEDQLAAIVEQPAPSITPAQKKTQSVVKPAERKRMPITKDPPKQASKLRTSKPAKSESTKSTARGHPKKSPSLIKVIESDTESLNLDTAGGTNVDSDEFDFSTE